MRWSLILGLAGTLLALSAPAQATRPETRSRPRPPNLVLILADDLGYAELGCYGQTGIRTPELDRMAQEGIRFTQAYAPSPVCAPTRCSLLTGRHQGHAFVRDNQEIRRPGSQEFDGQLPLPAGTATLAQRLREAGYRTGIFGKWGLGGPHTDSVPDRLGFDTFYGYLCQRHAHDHYPAYLWRNRTKEALAGNPDDSHGGATYAQDRLFAEARSFVREHRDRPFFLYLPTVVPHLALQVPEDSLAEYRGRFPDTAYDGKKGYRPHAAPRAAYAAMVTRLDREVGALLALLRELGLERDTLVVFTSDNGATIDIGGADSGFFASTGPYRGRKMSLHEGGLRVPLLARWPGTIPAGTGSDRITGLQDLAATFLDLAGAAPLPAQDGISLAPTLLGRGRQPEHPWLYFEFRSAPGGPQQALRMGQWKALRRITRDGPAATQLYDLALDPGETADRAGSHPEIVARVHAAWAEAHTPSAEFPLRPR